MSTPAMNVEISGTDEGGRRPNNRIRTYTTRCAATVLILGITSFLIFHWVTINTKDPKYSVTAAVLSRFNLTTTANTTTTAALSYRLSLNISIRNPNRYDGYYYDMVRATAYYGSQKAVISTHVVLPTFFQHAKNTTVLGPVMFEAENVEVFVGKNDIGDYFRQVELRVYDILVEVEVTTRDKHVDDKETVGTKNMVHCELKVPLQQPDQFRSTDCTVRGPIWDDDA